ncbi:alanine:cation symporter family protein [Oerskovia sp. M15]
MIQSLGVFVDTIVVCSATALIILMAGPEVFDPGTTTDAAGRRSPRPRSRPSSGRGPCGP